MSAEHMMSQTIDDLVVVIPAGGVGSRLWPLSTPDRPKFLLDLRGTGSSMLQDTVERLSPLTTHMLVVTGQRHASAVRAQLPDLAADRLLTEVSPRNSMAAIGLAAAVIEHRRGPAIIGSFAADHVIGEPEAFRDSVRAAVEVAREGQVVTIGIEPTAPSTAYGYIRQGEPLADHAQAHQVAAFTEKPDADTAARMIGQGDHVWNAGMFVTRTDVLLGHLERLQPTLYAGLREIAVAWDTDQRDAVVERVWPTLTSIAIDHAIAEPVAAEGGMAVVPGQFDWHDVGDFASLASVLTPNADGVVTVGRSAPVVTADAARAMVVGGDVPVAIVGLDDAVVVHTDHALLILGRDAAQQVTRASAALPD
ncbi:MAG: mannose-1-phosphate guanylyltransferase [Demequina sp.]